MLMCIKIGLFPIINQNLQKPMIHWLLHSIGDSHVVFVTKSSRTNVSLAALIEQTGADEPMKKRLLFVH